MFKNHNILKQRHQQNAYNYSKPVGNMSSIYDELSGDVVSEMDAGVDISGTVVFINDVLNWL